MADTKLKVTQVKSVIGAKPKTRGTMRALGLRRIGMSNTLPDSPDVRGMIARVPHLIRVEEVDTVSPTGGAGSDEANPSAEGNDS